MEHIIFNVVTTGGPFFHFLLSSSSSEKIQDGGKKTWPWGEKMRLPVAAVFDKRRTYKLLLLANKQ